MKKFLARLLSFAIQRYISQARTPSSSLRRFNLLNTLLPSLRKNKIKIKSTPNNNHLFLVNDPNDAIVIARPSRFLLYKNGISIRLNQILTEYCIEYIQFDDNDLIVDCGANIGEFTKVIRKQANVSAIAVEPDPLEFEALEENLDSMNSHLYQELLWNKKENLNLYQRNNTGDSSIFSNEASETSITLTSTTLDELIENDTLFAENGRIKIVKLEAEGAEPEIIQGGERILRKAEYVTVDCGPERGKHGENTFIDVYKNLKQLDFEPIAFNHFRTVFLFENKSYRP